MPTTTNMGLILPDVSVTIGPTYATNNNTAFTTVDSHDHTAGKGVLIPTGGLNINADLDFNSNSAIGLQKVMLDNQVSLLTGNNFFQVQGGEAYFNDGSGNQVQITNAGSLDITSSGGIGGDYTSAGASLIYTDATRTYTFRDGVPTNCLIQAEGIFNEGKYEWNTAAPAGNLTIIDTDQNFIILVDTSAARTITLPDPTLGKRVVKIKDKDGTADDFPITVAPNGAENIDTVAASIVINTPFGCLTLVSDLTNWFIIDKYDGDDRRGHSLTLSLVNPTTVAATTTVDLDIASIQATKGTYMTADAGAETITFSKAGLYKIDYRGNKLNNGDGPSLVFLDGDSVGDVGNVAWEHEAADDVDESVSFVADVTDVTDTYHISYRNNDGSSVVFRQDINVLITYLGDAS